MSVAPMTDEQLLAMQFEDLLDVIRLSRGLDGDVHVADDLKKCDHDTLLGFALLARDKCKREIQVSSVRFERRPWFSA